MPKPNPKPVLQTPKPKFQPPKPARKPKPAAKNTLPQHNLAAPYSRLLTIGEAEPTALYAEIARDLQQAGATEAVTKLVQIAQDESYYDYLDEDDLDLDSGMDDPRAWTRLHAVRVLMQMGTAAQAAVKPLLPLLDEEDDWLREEMPLFYAAIGRAAIEPLQELLLNPGVDTYMRTGAGDSLEQIAEDHPEVRETIVPLLVQTLDMEAEDDVVAAFLVCNLLDLKAQVSLPSIRKAFAEQRVDESVVEMRDVEEHFGLALTTPTRRDADKRAAAQSAEESAASRVAAAGATGEANPTKTPYVAPPKLGRNEPCWCGSGKKFKQCHGG